MQTLHRWPVSDLFYFIIFSRWFCWTGSSIALEQPSSVTFASKRWLSIYFARPDFRTRTHHTYTLSLCHALLTSFQTVLRVKGLMAANSTDVKKIPLSFCVLNWLMLRSTTFTVWRYMWITAIGLRIFGWADIRRVLRLNEMLMPTDTILCRLLFRVSCKYYCKPCDVRA